MVQDLDTALQDLNRELASLLQCVSDTSGAIDAIATATSALAGEHLAARLAQALQDARARADAAAVEFADAAVEVVDEVEGDLAAAATSLDELDALLDQAAGACHERFDQLEAGVAALSGALIEAKSDADEAITALTAGLDEAVEAVGEAMTELASDGEEALTEMTEQIVADIREPIAAAADQCAEDIGEMVERMTTEVLPEKTAEVAEAWTGELKTQLEEMTGELREGLAAFRQTVSDGTSASGESRGATQLIVDQLKTVVDPVLNELNRVKSLAGTVGISI